MSRHRFGDTPIIELLPEPMPVATDPAVEFADQSTTGPGMPQTFTARPSPRTTRARSVLYLIAVAAALSPFAAGLPVAEEGPPAGSPATALAADAARVAAAVASLPIRQGSDGATWPQQRRFDALPEDLSTSSAQPATDSLRIIPSQPRVNPLLVRAFEALQADRLTAAEADYTAVLAREPHNTDALQGMATVALRRGQTAAAEVMFRRAVEADPMNAASQAGLLDLQPPEHAAGAESRLKRLIAAQPDEHRLRFALGNVFAASERWLEAQQEYFHAHTGDPQQPDYLFNLAVSLDRLHQYPLAADYYAAALAASARRPAQFEQALASARLGELAE